MPSNEHNDQMKQERIKEASLARKIILIVLLVFIILISIGGYSVYNYIKTGLSPVDPEDNEIINVEIPMGSGVGDIGEILEENEVISNGSIFRYYVAFKNESGFQAGEYQFSKSMEIDEIIESLKTGVILVDPLFTVTIPEGSNIETIAEIIGENTSVDEDEFLDHMTDEEYIESLIELYPNLLSKDILDEDIRYPLEGYLYAITYPFYSEDQTVNEIVEMMLQQTQNQIYAYIDQMTEQGLSIHEAITMASLIEMEAVEEEDRHMISGVFYNRIEENMPLQTDPTVLYAMGEHKDRVLWDDLEYEHPFNTYLNEGLPPGPISNIHQNAMEAALYPTEHDYLYFVASYEGDVHYAETYAEHEENIEEYRPSREE
ncbi:endolytic transglycosylase MltG [Alkalibacillus aidingensis]|uniref:endolytic transglycosylase MltG n=1 Tax=Alkalibacillus aidingensis TaxID=2747607 RepID=UPI001CB6DE35|nr:endolytic transglycosylase MltG [Alkalibacillus aidingensis]